MPDEGSAANPEISIDDADRSQAPVPLEFTTPFRLITPDEAVFCWNGVGAVRMRGGHAITFYPEGGVDPGVVRTFLLGSAMGMLLHQRGYLVLHASAVGVDGYAVLFVGESGWGKSTTAAALHTCGFSMITDDIAAIDCSDIPSIRPGFPQMKLWPEALSDLGLDPAELPPIHSLIEKRAFRTPERFDHRQLPVGIVCILDRTAGPGCTRLSTQDGLIEMIRHSYVNAWLEQSGTLSRHLLQCAQVANHAAIFRVHPVNDRSSARKLGEELRAILSTVRKSDDGNSE
jgi:hypothetical protein